VKAARPPPIMTTAKLVAVVELHTHPNKHGAHAHASCRRHMCHRHQSQQGQQRAQRDRGTKQHLAALFNLGRLQQRAVISLVADSVHIPHKVTQPPQVVIDKGE
jgi:hypothetical protein